MNEEESVKGRKMLVCTHHKRLGMGEDRLQDPRDRSVRDPSVFVLEVEGRREPDMREFPHAPLVLEWNQSIYSFIVLFVYLFGAILVSLLSPIILDI